MFISGLCKAYTICLKSLADCQQSAKYCHQSKQTLWPACTATSSMDNDLLYWPYHSRETRLSNEEEEGKKFSLKIC